MRETYQIILTSNRDTSLEKIPEFQVFRFSDLNLGVPAAPSGFPLYLCSLNPAPKSRSRTKIPVPAPAPESRSQRMPLQSLTHSGCYVETHQ